MTWTARLKVDDVVHRLDGDQVHAWAYADERALVAPGTEVAAVTSNTEGKITAVGITFEFSGESPLAIGDVVTAYGHFQAPAPTEGTG